MASGYDGNGGGYPGGNVDQRRSDRNDRNRERRRGEKGDGRRPQEESYIHEGKGRGSFLDRGEGGDRMERGEPGRRERREDQGKGDQGRGDHRRARDQRDRQERHRGDQGERGDRTGGGGRFNADHDGGGGGQHDRGGGAEYGADLGGDRGGGDRGGGDRGGLPGGGCGKGERGGGYNDGGPPRDRRSDRRNNKGGDRKGGFKGDGDRTDRLDRGGYGGRADGERGDLRILPEQGGAGKGKAPRRESYPMQTDVSQALVPAGLHHHVGGDAAGGGPGRDNRMVAQSIDMTTRVNNMAIPDIIANLEKIANEENRASRNMLLVNEYVKKVRDHLHNEWEIRMTSANMADLTYSLGRLNLTDDTTNQVLGRIGEIAKYQADNFTAHDMSQIVYGFALVSARNEALMSVIAAEVVNKIGTFDQQQLANTAWAFAKCGLWNEQLVGCITEECALKIETFQPQSLAEIAWAMAQWTTLKQPLMFQIAEQVQSKTSQFQTAHLAMIAWSFASLQLKSMPLMTSISKVAISEVDSFKIHDIAHLAWAFANLRIQDPALFHKLAGGIQAHINGQRATQPPELANIAWAFSKNNFSHEPLMSVIAFETLQQLHKFRPGEVAMLTWAFAVAGLQNKQLMTGIGGLVAKRIEKFTPPQLSHIAWAFGALALRHSELLQSLSDHVYKDIKGFKAQGLSNIAWAFGMVNFTDKVLLQRVAPDIAGEVADLRPLALARCAWAYHMLNVHDTNLMKAITAEALSKIEEFPTKALVKLVDSTIFGCVEEQKELEEKLATRTREFAEKLQTFWNPDAVPASDEDIINTYTKEINHFGPVDFGVVGTLLLFRQLDIEAPGREFLKKVRGQAWLKEGFEHARPQPSDGEDSLDYEEFAAAKVQVEAIIDGEEEPHKLERWVVRYSSQPSDGSDGTDEEAIQAGIKCLIAVDLPGRKGKAEPCYLALAEICSHILALNVEADNPEARSKVRGSIEMLATLVPCLSSIGALQQFNVLFPNVDVEFTEKIGVCRDCRDLRD